MAKQKKDRFTDYYANFEKMQRWMINDLRNASIDAHANLLVGMGIFNYIEILGSFYHYDEKKAGSRDRFDWVFNQWMGLGYSKVFNDLDSLTDKGAYDVLRCGLTHEYLIKAYKMKDPSQTMEFTIFGVDNGTQYLHNIISMDCGIELISLDQKHFHLRIYNPRVIYDLNLAFENYKRSLRAGAAGVGETYRERFIKRCENIRFENFT